MNVELFNFSKRFNSTKVPTGTGQAFTGVNLKENCSVYQPVITFAVSSFSAPTVAPTIYNYALISKFQRYYFIDDWVYIGNVWEAHLTIDVLGTYKTSIGNLSTLVERAASSYDGNVVDNFYSKKVNSTISFVNMSSAFNGVAPMGGCFVIGVVGEPALLSANYNNLGGINYYALDGNGIKSLCSWMFSNSIWQNLNITDISEGLFKSMFNPIQYLVSCTWYPFQSFEFSSQSQCNVMFGYWNTGVTGYPVNVYAITTDITAQIPDHPQISRGAYLNYNPYTKATIYIPAFGAIPIDLSFRPSGDYIRARYLIDAHTGQAEVKVALWPQADLTNQNDGKVFFMKSGMVGVPIQISQAMVETVSSTGFNMGGWMDLGSLFKQFAFGTGYQTLAAGLTGSEGSYTGEYPLVSTNGSQGSFLLTSTQATLVVEHFMITDEDISEFGRPLMQVKTINTLSGFIKCADAHVSLPITEREKKTITEFMTTGFFYE